MIEALIVLGCFVIIILETNTATETAAFGLLGVIVASVVRNLSRD